MCCPCVAFSHELVLPTYPEMTDEIQSLTSLAAVIATWLRAKRDNAVAMVPRMRQEQKEHVLSFVKCYGVNLVRPKLHYSLHLPDQWLRAQKMHFPRNESINTTNRELRRV